MLRSAALNKTVKMDQPLRILFSWYFVSIFMMGRKIVTANVEVLDNDNTTVWEAPDLPARFGKQLPQNGIWGHLIDIESSGCDFKSFKSPPSTVEMHWIALIERGLCPFDQKVLNAQHKKYYAAIIYNDESDQLIPMGAGEYGGEVIIPSVFIGRSDAEKFKGYQNSNRFIFFLDHHMSINYWPLMKDFLIIASAAFAFGLFVGMAVLTIRWIRDVQRRRRSRLSTANLKKIPTKIFKKGDQYDVCAICLDEYEDGDRLRILPCSHAYHLKCIDPWLTKNKKTCPICKRKVIPGHDTESDSDEDADEENGNSENTPLLGTGIRSNSPLMTRGGTFDNSGLPTAVRSQIHPLSFSDSSDDDSSSVSNSIYQSSVEVHALNDSQYDNTSPSTLTNVMDNGDDIDETESADSLTQIDQNITRIDLPESDAEEGMNNPSLVVVNDYFEESEKSDCNIPAQQTSFHPRDNVNVSLVTAVDNIEQVDQIV